LTTEAGALLLPALLLSGRWRTLGGFASIVTAELIFYAVSYGRPLYRFTALGKNYLDDEMVRDANVDLFDRLVKEYPRMFVYPWYDLGYFGPHEQILRSRPGAPEIHYRGCSAGINVVGIESDAQVVGGLFGRNGLKPPA
jgi:hypothetical protein